MLWCLESWRGEGTALLMTGRGDSEGLIYVVKQTIQIILTTALITIILTSVSVGEN